MPQAEHFIRRLSAGVRLDAGELDFVRCLDAKPVAVPAHHDLIIEGEPLQQCVIFERGWGCRYALLEDGCRQILQFLLPGDHVGESGAILAQADHSVATLTPARLLLLPVGALTEVAASRPRLRLALEWSKYRDRAIAQARLIDIGRRSAFQRTAHLILELYHRLSLVGEAGRDSFILPLTQETLADALGLTTVHVNRTLGQLRRDGLIDLDHRRLVILEQDKLAGLAGFDASYLHHAPVRGAAIGAHAGGGDHVANPGPSADRAV